MSREDGGPAFPGGYAGVDESGEKVFIGMTLRDWFAGMAMQGLLSLDPTNTKVLSNPEGRKYQEWIASDAYKMADAMIERRENDNT